MGDTHRDPVDHVRTHHQHAGESMIDNYFWPGFFLLAMGLMALIGCVAAVAYQRHDLLGTVALVALVAVAAGSLWITLEHRRVRRIEARWKAEHPTGHSHRAAA